MAVEKNPEYEKAFRAMRRGQAVRRRLRQAGCLVLILIWLMLMLLPCGFVTLMVRKEIVISRSALPEHEYRFFLLQNPDQRGFGFSKGSVKSGGADEDSLCMLTNVSYLLWEGEAQNVRYCDCYEKTGDSWSAVMVGGDENCQPVSFEQEPETP